jgi:hypothetical protein
MRGVITTVLLVGSVCSCGVQRDDSDDLVGEYDLEEPATAAESIDEDAFWGGLGTNMHGRMTLEASGAFVLALSIGSLDKSGSGVWTEEGDAVRLQPADGSGPLLLRRHGVKRLVVDARGIGIGDGSQPAPRTRLDDSDVGARAELRPGRRVHGRVRSGRAKVQDRKAMISVEEPHRQRAGGQSAKVP